jgi:phage baseplate assembly protein W
MTQQVEKPLWKDVNQYNPTEDKEWLIDVEAIYQSLNNIFATKRYEKLFNPNTGIVIEEQLFEIIDDVTSIEILRAITEDIERQEPRIIINYSSTKVVPDPDNNRYNVELHFSIIGHGDRDYEFRGVVSK